jgi:hypothetical protein
MVQIRNLHTQSTGVNFLSRSGSASNASTASTVVSNNPGSTASSFPAFSFGFQNSSHGLSSIFSYFQSFMGQMFNNGCYGQTPTPTPAPCPTPTPTPAPYPTPTPTPAPCPTPTPTPTPCPPPPPPPAPCPPPPPPPPPYSGGNSGCYWGDPHLVGFDGEKYDVMGQAGNTYNMLSDQSLQYNATFAQFGNSDVATVISDAGLQVGASKVSLDASSRVAQVDGQDMPLNQVVNLDGGTALWDGSKLNVTNNEYSIDLTAQLDPNGTHYIDSTVNIIGDPFADGVKPHGLLGQTADGIEGQKNTGQDLGNQGGTVIDGTVNDYQVGGLFDTAFATFNRFNG